MICQHCKEEMEDSLLNEHHIHPRFMDNPKGDGTKCYLCKKCHTILHLTIPTLLWRNLSFEEKRKALADVTKFTEGYLK